MPELPHRRLFAGLMAAYAGIDIRDDSEVDGDDDPYELSQRMRCTTCDEVKSTTGFSKNPRRKGPVAVVAAGAFIHRPDVCGEARDEVVSSFLV
jgi:hypothetical protein